MVMHLEGGTRDHFLRFLAREFPTLTDRYEHLYASKYVPKAYSARVQEVVGLLRARYGVSGKGRRGEPETTAGK
jgi:hypothetical protein